MSPYVKYIAFAKTCVVHTTSQRLSVLSTVPKVGIIEVSVPVVVAIDSSKNKEINNLYNDYANNRYSISPVVTFAYRYSSNFRMTCTLLGQETFKLSVSRSIRW